MERIDYYTEEALERLKKELHELKTVGRKKAAQEISDAREKGDLSENAEYDAAKEAQVALEKKIKDLEVALGRARVLSKKDIDTSKVGLLSKVTLLNVKTNKEEVFTLVSEKEVDIKERKISIDSPIGKTLIDKIVGAFARVDAPMGEVEYKVLKIEA